MPVIAVTLLLLLLFTIVMLQIALASQKSKWPGLILPFIAFCFSLVIQVGFANFHQDPLSIVAQLLIVFMLTNIPTLILLLIYTIYRVNRKKDFDMQ